jgi:hypothetical protein
VVKRDGCPVGKVKIGDRCYPSKCEKAKKIFYKGVSHASLRQVMKKKQPHGWRFTANCGPFNRHLKKLIEEVQSQN